MWIVEGRADGLIGVVSKVHHSTIDGITGANMMAELFDLEPNAPDKEAAALHIARIRELKRNQRVRVLIAHDAPWYWPNRGGPAFLPGKLESL